MIICINFHLFSFVVSIIIAFWANWTLNTIRWMCLLFRFHHLYIPTYKHIHLVQGIYLFGFWIYNIKEWNIFSLVCFALVGLCALLSARFLNWTELRKIEMWLQVTAKICRSWVQLQYMFWVNCRTWLNCSTVWTVKYVCEKKDRSKFWMALLHQPQQYNYLFL